MSQLECFICCKTASENKIYYTLDSDPTASNDLNLIQKLLYCVPEFKKVLDDKNSRSWICGDCCKALCFGYSFRKMCLGRKSMLEMDKNDGSFTTKEMYINENSMVEEKENIVACDEIKKEEISYDLIKVEEEDDDETDNDCFIVCEEDKTLNKEYENCTSNLLQVKETAVQIDDCFVREKEFQEHTLTSKLSNYKAVKNKKVSNEHNKSNDDCNVKEFIIDLPVVDDTVEMEQIEIKDELPFLEDYFIKTWDTSQQVKEQCTQEINNKNDSISSLHTNETFQETNSIKDAVHILNSNDRLNLQQKQTASTSNQTTSLELNINLQKPTNEKNTTIVSEFDNCDKDPVLTKHDIFIKEKHCRIAANNTTETIKQDTTKLNNKLVTKQKICLEKRYVQDKKKLVIETKTFKPKTTIDNSNKASESTENNESVSVTFFRKGTHIYVCVNQEGRKCFYRKQVAIPSKENQKAPFMYKNQHYIKTKQSDNQEKKASIPKQNVFSKNKLSKNNNKNKFKVVKTQKQLLDDNVQLKKKCKTNNELSPPSHLNIADTLSNKVLDEKDKLLEENDIEIKKKTNNKNLIWKLHRLKKPIKKQTLQIKKCIKHRVLVKNTYPIKKKKNVRELSLKCSFQSNSTTKRKTVRSRVNNKAVKELQENIVQIRKQMLRLIRCRCKKCNQRFTSMNALKVHCAFTHKPR